MRQSFTTVIDGVRLVWDVEDLWAKFESLDPVDWKIPDSFKEEWHWGQSHPSEHLERCMNADLSYPILIWNGDIIDGCHRTIKALAKGEKSIKAKSIKNLPPPLEQGDIDPVESNEGIQWVFNDMVKILQAYLKYEAVKDNKFRHPADGI